MGLVGVPLDATSSSRPGDRESTFLGRRRLSRQGRPNRLCPKLFGWKASGLTGGAGLGRWWRDGRRLARGCSPPVNFTTRPYRVQES
jgi:hypothetical protein